MALKYFTEYRDFKENLRRIEIDSPTYTDEPIELIPTDQPLVIEHQGNNDDDPFKAHVVNSTAQIKVFNENLDIGELMLVNDASYKTRVYVNGVLDWQGFIIADGIKEVDAFRYAVTIKAIDGLELLDNVIFSWADNYPAIIVNGQTSAQRCPMNAIRLVLFASANLDNKLPIRWSVSLKNLEYPTDDALAGRTKLNNDGKLAIYSEKSAFWWIKNIVQSVGAWIIQRNGYWYIFSYADLINNNGTLDFWEIMTDTTVVQTATSVTVDLSQDGNDFVNENGSWWVKKPLGGANVTYQNTTNKGEVLPNGNFDLTSVGQVVDWQFNPIPLTNTSQLIYQSLYEREGNAVQLTSYADSAVDAEFTHDFTIPLDSKILFPSMEFGFTFMPQKGFPFNTSTGIINWDSNPLKLSVRYSAKGEFWYLNEFGFWQYEGRGLDLGTQFVRRERETSGISPNLIYIFKMYFEGSPNVGDVLTIRIKTEVGGDEYNSYSFTVTSAEEGQLGLALDGLLASLPNSIDGWTVGNKSVVLENDNLGYVRFSYYVGLGNAEGETSKSTVTQEYRFIYPFVESLKLNDIAQIPFSGKGGNSQILIPEIDEFNTEQGTLKITFYVKPGQQYVLDDVYFRVPENNDVYNVWLSSSKNAKEDYTMEISSSFSGHLLSSYMDRYNASRLSMFWTGNKTLTQIYGETIMNWRNKPCRIFEGDIDGRIEWGLLSIRGVNYVPLTITYNAKDDVSSVTAIEIRQEIGTYSVVHKSSADS
jgi:hypothetical protein